MVGRCWKIKFPFWGNRPMVGLWITLSFSPLLAFESCLLFKSTESFSTTYQPNRDFPNTFTKHLKYTPWNQHRTWKLTLAKKPSQKGNDCLPTLQFQVLWLLLVSGRFFSSHTPGDLKIILPLKDQDTNLVCWNLFPFRCNDVLSGDEKKRGIPRHWKPNISDK